MSDNEKSSQLDFINTMMDDITNLYKYCISLEERIGNIEFDMQNKDEDFDKLQTRISVQQRTIDTMSDNVYSMYKTLMSVKAELVKFDDIDSDLNHIFHLTYCGDNFCGNCEHCVSCPDGLYRCDLTNLELDPDSASCIRFKCPQVPKSDAEICKACPDIDTPRCHKCSYFPF